MFQYAAVMDFLNQQVHFIEEQNHRDLLENSVVDDCVEYVPGLLHPVGLPVLQDHLVELRAGGHEQDAGDRLEALEPFLPLSPLSPNVDKEKRHTVNFYSKLDNSFGSFSAIQNVLKNEEIFQTEF